MDTSTDSNAETHRSERVEIVVNKRPVVLPGKEATGVQIKQAAIEQGVSTVHPDSRLFRLADDAWVRVPDGETIKVHDGEQFRAQGKQEDSGFTPAVAEQIEELRVQFPGKTVTAEPDDAGGAYVMISPIDPGPAYKQRESWLGFQISYLCPDSDIYPLFLRPDLERVDGQPHKPPITKAEWRKRSVLQYSLRSPQRDPATETAAIKAAGVIACLAERS